ncbi:MAG: ATPase [Euryarchaeota archaeon]|nr:ATPase [Euryarchaeota archaeon]
MLPVIGSGIPGFDKLVSNEKTGIGGIPENTSTLIYGPPKTGKSIFCYQFMYHGLSNEEPCLYIMTDYGIKQFQQKIADYGWDLGSSIENQMFYIIDALSSVSGTEVVETATCVSSSVHNPTDIMVKLGVGTRFMSGMSPRFRSVIDSLTTLLAFNEDMLVVRVLTAFIMRIKEAGGTAVITYTEGSADTKIETMLKASVDNIIRLDGEQLVVEAMVGCGKRNAPYIITDKGIIIKE